MGTNRPIDPVLPDLLSVEDLPSMPAAAVKVLRLVQQEDVTLDALADAIAVDPALAGKLLRLANSPLFSVGAPVSTLGRAMMVLGLKTVKLMALSFSLADSLKTDGRGAFPFAEYWRRSLVCAVSARAIAGRSGSRLEDESFLGGLLCRVGQLVLGSCLEDRYAEVLKRAAGRWPDPVLERSVLGCDGFQVGAALLHSWGLGSPIAEGVGGLGQEKAEAVGDEIDELSRVLRLALEFEALLCDGDAGPALDRVVGCASELLGMDPVELEDLLAGLREMIAETGAVLEIDTRQISLDQILSEARETLVRESLGVAGEMARAQRRTVELEASNRELRDTARRDPLTGLWDRACFDEGLRLGLEGVAHAGSGEGLGLLMIDVDHFKSVNDTYGHPTGDDVLRMLAGTIDEQTRGNDITARYGGEEFGILMAPITEQDLALAAERIRSAIAEKSILVGAVELSVTVSVGGAHLVPGSGPIEARALLEQADRALYRAKDGGRNRCELTAIGGSA